MINDTVIFLFSSLSVVALMLFYGFIIYVAYVVGYSNGRLELECMPAAEPRLRTWYDAPIGEREIVQDEP